MKHQKKKELFLNREGLIQTISKAEEYEKTKGMNAEFVEKLKEHEEE